ncbi:MAG: DUF5009 domain-containing protein [bacterium]|nr:DUF5009 domain-containing protein [bacterium]
MSDKPQRFISVDLLRAIAILGMILSGYIAFGGVMPAWMYHAQLPPPTHAFNPEIPGLTWVDLVFPMFLFTMGIAFPFSLRKRLNQSAGIRPIIQKISIRFFLLVYFAIYLQHIKPYNLSSSPSTIDWGLSLIGFILLLGAFGGYQKFFKTKIAGQYSFLMGSLLFLAILEASKTNFEFSLYRSDIIILVLANVAFFGALAWIITKDNALHRVLIIIGVLGLKLGATIPDAWTNELWTFDAISWLFRVSFLEYLIIVLAGSIVGDWLQSSVEKRNDHLKSESKSKSLLSLSIVFLIVVMSLIGLFARWEFETIVIQSVLVIALFTIKKANPTEREITILSAALLIIGMLMEPFEGGVKKDPTTISYLFISAGLSGSLLLFCMDLLKVVPTKSLSWLIDSGQNPMVAYVLPTIFLFPVFGLLDVHDWINYLNANEWTGLLKGLIYTTLAMIITSMLTKRGFILKT